MEMGHIDEGSIPFTRSIYNQGVMNVCSKSAVSLAPSNFFSFHPVTVDFTLPARFVQRAAAGQQSPQRANACELDLPFLFNFATQEPQRYATYTRCPLLSAAVAGDLSVATEYLHNSVFLYHADAIARLKVEWQRSHCAGAG
ncbi:MAG: hypothetical protein ACLQAH_10720 [Limisphaerales bacterium]